MQSRQKRSVRKWFGQARREAGQAAIETALVSLVLLLLFAGAADVGRMFYHYIAVTNAAREGARTASRLPCDSAVSASRTAVRNAIVTSATREAASVGTVVLPANVTISPDPVATGCAAAGASITVAVGYDFTNIFTNLVGSAGVRISNRATMVAFGSDTGG